MAGLQPPAGDQYPADKHIRQQICGEKKGHWRPEEEAASGQRKKDIRRTDAGRNRWPAARGKRISGGWLRDGTGGRRPEEKGYPEDRCRTEQAAGGRQAGRKGRAFSVKRRGVSQGGEPLEIFRGMPFFAGEGQKAADRFLREGEAEGGGSVSAGR